ncbi:unnamed protein product [Rhizoctonia solani]|uniref:CHAT domain-containing protein n=1 Tax=Rhizoctonia solani TaxID=456999 RepID=A0A8H3CV14_9AGAM|nr:unnamed protein product [Rhizoctonia solani]CAE6492216.1 unnamed protein product [Rhizoctonia solani]
MDTKQAGDTPGRFGNKEHDGDHLDNLDDDKAIELLTQAVSLTPNCDTSLTQQLDNLGRAHNARYQRLGMLDDLVHAIMYKSRAVSLSKDNPTLATRLESLSSAYTTRFQRLGESDDLEKAISYGTQALSIVSEGDPDLPKYLENLGTSHETRFQCLGELGDIEKAIEYLTHAVSLTPDSHPDLLRKLEGLGRAHETRFQCLKKFDDSEKALDYQTRVLLLTPEGHPDLPKRLENLGSLRLDKYKLLGQPEDIKAAVDYMARAVSMTPDDHVDMCQRSINLGVGYLLHFECSKVLDDLEQAIIYISSAVLLTPEGHPVLPENLCILGRARQLQFQESGQIEHLHNSLDCFRKSANYTVAHPRRRFDAARQWARLAAKYDIPDFLEAYQTTIDLIPHFVWLGTTVAQRYEDIRNLNDLAVEAASVAIGANNNALALEWLENARCVVWSQLLFLRPPLDHLRSNHPNLADRIQKVATVLHDASLSSSIPSDTRERQTANQQRRRLALEYDHLILQTRSLSGLEDFLKPKQAAELIHFARQGPVTVINCHETRCDALIISPGQTEVARVPLSQSTYKNAQHARAQMETSFKSMGVRERGPRSPSQIYVNDGVGDVLATLWEDVAKPILDFLGYTYKSTADEMPHITWCPTGILSSLPIHAAGDYDQPHSTVFDYVISSYTPSLAALLSPAPRSSNVKPRILVVGQEATPGHSPLPGTVQELAHIRDHANNKFELSQILNNNATAPAVLDAMEQHDWAHFACHAHQNVQDPTKSGFFLYESILDLDSITRPLFGQKGLAFLSACQTAASDENIPDEAVHLASGMLMAGYSSVIATMWSVLDDDAPFVADKVYGQLMQTGKVGNGEGARALHNAMTELRAKVGVKEFGRWVPYIHIGS